MKKKHNKKQATWTEMAQRNMRKIETKIDELVPESEQAAKLKRDELFHAQYPNVGLPYNNHT